MAWIFLKKTLALETGHKYIPLPSLEPSPLNARTLQIIIFEKLTKFRQLVRNEESIFS